MFQTRLANCGLTVGTRLIVRDTVAVDTLARFAISRMSIAIYQPKCAIINCRPFPDGLQNSICMSLEELAVAKLDRAPIHCSSCRNGCSQKIFASIVINEFAEIDGWGPAPQTISHHTFCSTRAASRTYEKMVGGKRVRIRCRSQLPVINVVVENGIPAAAETGLDDVGAIRASRNAMNTRGRSQLG